MLEAGMIKLLVAILIGTSSHVEETRTIYSVKVAAITNVSTV
jgi:hypothetical protein